MLAIAVVFIAIVIPTAIFAAGLVTCEGPICGVCDLVSLGQEVLNFLIYLAVALATLMFAWAGLKYATSATNPSQIEAAHKIFWNVFFGLVLVLVAWLIVDAIMKSFYQDQKYGPWNELLCKDGSAYDSSGGN